MSQIETSKLTGWAYLASPVDRLTASKVVGYAWVLPGNSGPDTSNRQGHCFVQIVRR